MSFMNTITSLLGQGSTSPAEQPTPQQHASIAQAFMQHFSSQPGGLSNVTDQFRQNGMGGHVDSWLSSQPGSQPTQALQPQQVEQGVGADGLQSIAQRAGVSPGMVKIALAAALPLLMSHLSQGSGALPAQANEGGGLAGLAQGLFSHVL